MHEEGGPPPVYIIFYLYLYIILYFFFPSAVTLYLTNNRSGESFLGLMVLEGSTEAWRGWSSSSQQATKQRGEESHCCRLSPFFSFSPASSTPATWRSVILLYHIPHIQSSPSVSGALLEMPSQRAILNPVKLAMKKNCDSGQDSKPLFLYFHAFCLNLL